LIRWGTYKRWAVDSVDSRNIPPAHTAHSPDDGGDGPVFDSQTVLFSIVKVQARCPKWLSFR